MPARGLRIGSIGGISIEVHPTWFVIAGVVTCLLAVGFFPDRYEGAIASYWLLGAAGAVLVFVAVLLHELAHAVVARLRGLPVPRITLFIFGGVSHPSSSPRSAGEEFVIAAAGPAVSFALALALFGLSFPAGGSHTPPGAMFEYLAIVNLILGIFNSLPGLPLDGGRVLRSIVWRCTRDVRKGTRVATGVGELLGWALIAGGAVFLFMTEWLSAAGALLIGWFLVSSARSEAETTRMEDILRRLRARDLLDRTFPRVPPGMPVQTVVEERMIEQGERAVVVASDDNVLGILTVRNLARLPRREWPATPAQRIMTPRADIATIAADAPAIEVVPLLARHRLNPLPVLDEGRMIGLITRREFYERLLITDELGQDDRPDSDAAPPSVGAPDNADAPDRDGPSPPPP